MHIIYNRTLFCPSAPQNRKFERSAGVTDINFRNLVHFVREEMGWFVLATLLDELTDGRLVRASLLAVISGGHLSKLTTIVLYSCTLKLPPVSQLWIWKMYENGSDVLWAVSGYLSDIYVVMKRNAFLEKHSAYRLLGAMVILLQIITPCATHSCPEPTSDVTVLNSGNQCKSCCCVLGVQVGRLYHTQCSPCESCTRAYQDWRGKYQWWDRQPNGRSRMVARTKRTRRGATDIWTWINQEQRRVDDEWVLESNNESPNFVSYCVPGNTIPVGPHQNGKPKRSLSWSVDADIWNQVTSMNRDLIWP